MKKNNLIRENILVTLAKMLAAFQIQKKIGAAMDKIPNDPEIKQALVDLKNADEKVRISLSNFCKAHPDHPKCKDKSESK